MPFTPWASLFALTVLPVQIYCAIKVWKEAKAFGGNRLRRALCWLCFGSPVEGGAAEVEEEVAELVAERSVRIAQHSIYGLWLAFAWNSLDISRESMFDTVKHPGFTAAKVAALHSLTIGVVLPHHFLTWKTLPFLHAMCMFFLCCMSLATVPPHVEHLRREGLGVGALAAGGLCLRFRTLVLTNICFEVSFHIGTSFTLTEGAENARFRVMFSQLSLLLVRLVILRGAEFVVESGARKEVECRLGQCQQSAVSSLLGMMCDAVVDLDHELRFRSHCPKLAGMLMLNEGRSLEGSSLTAYIPDGEDRERFDSLTQQVCMGRHETPMPTMITLRLRDSIGNLIRVVFFHVPYRGLVGQIQHLFGLREDTDVGAGRRMPDAVSELMPMGPNVSGARRPFDPGSFFPGINRKEDSAVPARTWAKEKIPGEGGDADAASSSSSRSSRSSISLVSRASQSNDKPDPRMSVEVFVDATFTVSWAAKALAEDLGLAPGDSFAKVMPDSGDALRRRLQEAIDQARCGGSDGDFKLEYGDFELTRMRESTREIIIRKAWIYFPAPLEPADGSTYLVSIAMTKGRKRRGVALSGTAATARRESFGDFSPPRSGQKSPPA